MPLPFRRPLFTRAHRICSAVVTQDRRKLEAGWALPVVAPVPLRPARMCPTFKVCGLAIMLILTQPISSKTRDVPSTFCP